MLVTEATQRILQSSCSTSYRLHFAFLPKQGTSQLSAFPPDHCLSLRVSAARREKNKKPTQPSQSEEAPVTRPSASVL